MEETLISEYSATLVVAPPYLHDTELKVSAVDVSVTGRLPPRSSGLVGICFGGHPAAECLLEATGQGLDHAIIVAVVETLPCHLLFALRLRQLVKSDLPITVVTNRN